MRRRTGLRGRTDFNVLARDGQLSSRCRCIEISTSGIVIDRGRPVRSSDARIVLNLELHLPERSRAVRTIARPVWSMGSQQAFKFLKMSDSDRLSVAEHLDVLRHGGRELT